MKFSLKFMALLVLFVGGTFSFPLLSIGNTSPIDVSITLPKQSVDLSDLDVRDKFNRRVTSVAAQEKMRRLFITSLNQMLLFNLTPATQSRLELMQKIWNKLTGMVTRLWYGNLDRLAVWWQNKKDDLLPNQSTSTYLDFSQNQQKGSQPNARNSYQFLVRSILSSTIILR
jgi:hypothetical protein